MVQQVQADAPDLFQEPEEQVPFGTDRGAWGYWKRGPQMAQPGWVIIGAAFYPNRLHFEQKGMSFLEEYGTFLPDSGHADATPKNSDVRGRAWNAFKEPWRLILQKGGAREFPVDQVLAFHWHRQPPYRGVDFPQLKGVQVYDLQCRECDRLFSSTNPRETVRQLRAHLSSKINQQHNYTPADMDKVYREVADAWGLDFNSAQVGQRSVVPPPIGKSSEEQPEPQNVVANICGVCGWEPPLFSKNRGAALRMHIRTKHGGR